MFIHIIVFILHTFPLLFPFLSLTLPLVLTATGYLASKNTYRRLWETNQMIMDCLEPASLTPLSGLGWQSCLRVRFLHCKVRTRLSKSPRWDTSAWGVPINQEDMAVTILAFQYNILFVFDVLGIATTAQEREDYTHLWRFIAHLMGVLDEHNACASFARSRSYLESIVMHLIDPDETSRYLANHVIASVQNRPPVFWSYSMHAQLARMLMGDELADKLHLPNSAFFAAVHHVHFMMIRAVSALSDAPWGVGERVQRRNLEMVKGAIRRGLGGERTNFTMSRAFGRRKG